MNASEIIQFIKENQIESAWGGKGWSGLPETKLIIHYGACQRAEISIIQDDVTFKMEGFDAIGIKANRHFHTEIRNLLDEARAEIEVFNKLMSVAKQEHEEQLDKMRKIFVRKVNQGDFDEMLEEMLAMGFDKMMEKEE